MRVWKSVKEKEAISEHYAKTNLIPFLSSHKTNDATLQICNSFKPSDCEGIVKILCEGLQNCKLKDFTMLSYPDVSESFIKAQIAHGGLKSLDLNRSWPSDVVELLLKLYLKEDNPRITLESRKTRLQNDKERFETIMHKFFQGNFSYLRGMFGDFELTSEYVHSLQKDIQVLKSPA